MLTERGIIPKVFLVIAMLTSGYALTTTKYSPVIYLSCLAGGAIFTILLSIKIFEVKARKFQLALLLLLVLLLPAVVGTMMNASEENISGLAKFTLAVMFGSILFILFDFRTFEILFSNTVLLICIVSLPLYLIANFTESIGLLPLVKNVNDVGYRFALIFVSFDGFLKYRNVGVFWEPGIFATMIFAALVADLYSKEKVNAFRVGAFLVALVTTFSGAAIIFFLIYASLIFFYPHRKNGNNIQKQIIPVFAIVFIVCIFSLYMLSSQSGALAYLERLVGKITSPEQTQSARFLSPIIGFQVFFDRPVFGWGFAGALDEYRFLNDEIALTSTSAYLMSAIGVSGVLFTLLPMLGVARQRSLNFPTRILLIFSFLFVINKEPHTYFTLTHALAFFSLAALASRDGRNEKALGGRAIAKRNTI